MPNLPGIQSAEEEDDQTNDSLSVPPLHPTLGVVTVRRSAADVCHKTQQAGVTLSI